jgi:hypothetical protein
MEWGLPVVEVVEVIAMQPGGRVRCYECESFVEAGHSCDGLPGVALIGRAKWVFLAVLAVVLVASGWLMVAIPGTVPLVLSLLVLALPTSLVLARSGRGKP